MTKGLEGRVVFVTGAGRNIGREIALQCAREGAHLVLCTQKSKDLLEETAHAVEKQGAKVLAELCDVADGEQVHSLVERALQEFGRIDVLVNNAVYRSERSLLETPFEEWQRNIAVNLTGPYLTCRAVLPGMLQRRWGRIINFSGIAAYHGSGAAKATVKLGIVGLTRGLAREVGPYGVTVNCIAPGTIQVARDPGQEWKLDTRRLEGIPIARLGTPEEIAALVVYLAGEQAAYITGQCFHVNGGAYFS